MYNPTQTMKISPGATRTLSICDRWNRPTMCVSNCHASWTVSIWNAPAPISRPKTITLTFAKHSSKGSSCRSPIWSAPAIIWRSRTIRWCSCIRQRVWTTNPTGCCTTSLCWRRRTTFEQWPIVNVSAL